MFDAEIHVRHRHHILQEIVLYHVGSAAVVGLVRRVDALEVAALVVDEEDLVAHGAGQGAAGGEAGPANIGDVH